MFLDTAANRCCPSGDHETCRAMIVGWSPKSVTCRHEPSAVPSAHRLVVAPSASPIASHRSSGERLGCKYNGDIGTRTRDVPDDLGCPVFRGRASNLRVPASELRRHAGNVIEGAIATDGGPGRVVVPPDNNRRPTADRKFLDTKSGDVAIGRVVEPASIFGPARRHSAIDDLARSASVRPNHPQLRYFSSGDEHNEIACRRPPWNTDGRAWIGLKSDLSRLCAISLGHPQVPVTAVVRQIHEGRAIGTERRRLHLPGLSRHLHGVPGVLDGRILTGNFQISA